MADYTAYWRVSEGAHEDEGIAYETCEGECAEVDGGEGTGVPVRCATIAALVVGWGTSGSPAVVIDKQSPPRKSSSSDSNSRIDFPSFRCDDSLIGPELAEADRHCAPRNGMFGNKNRRTRAASNPPLTGTTTNPSAATAAAQAFLKNQASNASLSNAAAAAALRSRPTTPTNVADTQTKRTLRRSGSASSLGSSVAGSARGPAGSPLERRGSFSSMSERTFRDPSPSAPVPSAVDAPPVPALPRNIQQTAPSIQSHRRAASLEAPVMRGASPPASKASGRGSSLGPGTAGKPPRRAGRGMYNLSSVSETERPASRGANIARIVSPANQNLIYDPNTRSFLPEAEILAIEQRILDTSQQPGKRKKRAPQAAATHLSQGLGTAGGRPRGTFIDALEADQPTPVGRQTPAPAPASQSAPAPAPVPEPVQAAAPEPTAAVPKEKKKKKMVVVGSDLKSDQGSLNPNLSDNDSDSLQSHPYARAGAFLAKRPSIVHEDKEREDEEDDTPKRVSDGSARLDADPGGRQGSPSPLPRSTAGRGYGRGQALASAGSAQGRLEANPTRQPAPSPTSSAVEDVGLTTQDGVRGGRLASVSPMRTTHFAASPENLIVRHQPPARSISPRKSALKHSNSPRGPSPVEGSSGGQEKLSEALNDSIVRPESLAPKKKANRVSFDETNVVVGEAAAPVTTDSSVDLSPQTKRQWFSIGRGKKKETAVVVADDSEVMKPRPALPSFGSVRDKKISREVEERPLVKPAENTEAFNSASPALFTPPTDEVSENPFGLSNDHVAGAVFAQDAASKNAANISKSREPLPPQTTSVEGNGYYSDSDSSLYSVDNRLSDAGITRANSVKCGPEDGDADTYRALASSLSHEIETPAEEGEAEAAMAHGRIPRIAVLQATPTLDNTELRGEWLDMPGSWANSNSDSSSQEADEPCSTVVEHPATEPTLADAGIAEPDPETPHAGSPVLGDVAAHNSQSALQEEPDESDADASIYSDAAEDFSDAEGTGFISLDAVADSPIAQTNTPGLGISTPPDSSTTKTAKTTAYQRSQMSRQPSEPDMDQGWEKVQAYWSTLSAEKKRQLEMEAREEAEGSETEVEDKPAPRPKKKKVSVEPTPIYLEPQRQVGSERTYMISPGTKAGANGHASMKSSMRAEPLSTAEDPRIRMSMRGPASMRGSLRAEESKGALQRKHRPVSLPAPENPTARGHARNLSAASAAAAQGAAGRDLMPKPALRRKNSAGSDSSFKRSSPRGSDIPSFRSSMRGSVDSSTTGRPQSQSSRFSIRSLSPAGSAVRRPLGSTAAPQSSLSETHLRNSMRNSMRNPYDTTPSMRSKPPPKRAGGFGRSAPPKTQQKPTRRFASRFADSSDEEEERPSFRSRFVDSSDDDEPTPLKPVGRTMRNNAPVRAISKRSGIDEGDSSELPDSDDEKAKPPQSQNGSATAAAASQLSTSLRRSGSGRGTISLPAAEFHPKRAGHSRRGSLMSILRRKKPDATSRVHKSGAESPARRDAPLEHSRSGRGSLRAEAVKTPVTASTPKLQKRNPMSRENSGAWPLGPTPLSIKGGDDGRPFTADGGNGVVGGKITDVDLNEDGLGNGKPELGTRRYTDDLVAAGRKKKKFGALRRMFRLDE
ncbi:hypothetical protein B2J93_4967 [Marssonina coronariae]|uniref:Uncharacterized protein n=1 Tax=Diplocarpon coronariae TaxID=2795749 RepID=A0A218ZHH4_9HELO|nr:hypothetical protein B2J93_4967 [Marssonina coronariae]